MKYAKVKFIEMPETRFLIFSVILSDLKKMYFSCCNMHSCHPYAPDCRGILVLNLSDQLYVKMKSRLDNAASPYCILSVEHTLVNEV